MTTMTAAVNGETSLYVITIGKTKTEVVQTDPKTKKRTVIGTVDDTTLIFPSDVTLSEMNTIVFRLRRFRTIVQAAKVTYHNRTITLMLAHTGTELERVESALKKMGYRTTRS